MSARTTVLRAESIRTKKKGKKTKNNTNGPAMNKRGGTAQNVRTRQQMGLSQWAKKGGLKAVGNT